MTQYTGEVSDDIGLTDDTFGAVVCPLFDGIGVDDAIDSFATYQGILEDSVELQDILSTVLSGAVSDSIGIGDDQEGFLSLLGAVYDAVVISGAVDSRARAIGIVADSLILNDEVRTYFAGFVSDSFTLSDDVDSRARLIGFISDALAVDDQAVPSIRMYGQVEDSLAIGDDLGSLVRLLGEVEDGIILSAIIQLPGGEYLAYVVNPKLLASSTYDNYPFNSFAELNGVYYGLTDTALYQLTGDTDDGTPIAASLKTGFTNLGTLRRKNVPRMYLGHSSDGELLLKTISSHSGEKIERWYKLVQTSNAYRESRVKMSRGVQSTYWQFELLSVDGSRFSLDTMKLLPVVFGRVLS